MTCLTCQALCKTHQNYNCFSSLQFSFVQTIKEIRQTPKHHPGPVRELQKCALAHQRTVDLSLVGFAACWKALPHLHPETARLPQELAPSVVAFPDVLSALAATTGHKFLRSSCQDVPFQVCELRDLTLDCLLLPSPSALDSCNLGAH